MTGQVDRIKKWEVKSSTGRHFDVLDGIRGVAILMVVSFHAFYINPQYGRLVRAAGYLLKTGGMGVSIFFVLSGFLISYPFFRQKETDPKLWYYPGYARRRVGKIFPPFILSLVLFAGYDFIHRADPEYLRAAAGWLLGLPNFIPETRNINASYWSLAVEAHFYIVLPFLFLLTRGLKSRPSALVIFLILFLAPLVMRQITWPGTSPTAGQIFFLMNRFPCSLDYFGWGVLFAGFFASLPAGREQLRSRAFFGCAGVALLVATIGFMGYAFCAYGVFDYPTRWSVEALHLFPSLSAFLLLFLMFDRDAMATRALSHPVIRFIGVVSYEWFLFHQPVLEIFGETFGSSHGSAFGYALRNIIPLAVTFGFSVLVYRYFSLPLLNKIRGGKAARG